MPLNEFINIPQTATVGGAPIDAFQADAFRRNDSLFHRLFLSILSSPLIPNGKDGPLTDPSAERLVNATTITVASGTTINLTNRVPLIWMATESITIEGTIDADGRGAQNGETGDFGGSGGGGGGNPGQPTQTPVTNVPILQGGDGTGGGGNGNNANPDWATRALAFLPLCKGGASGAGGANGEGGGVVFLCAPTITITGNITAQGNGGPGGGGGGLIVLIGNDLSTVDDGVNVVYGGGASTGGGGNGGNGILLVRDFN
ncbi:MAG: hypothetical protein AAF388_00045 [Bacteroidota bacterium]